MTPYNRNLSIKPNQWLRSLVLLAAISTLLACSEPDVNASDTTSATKPPVVTQPAQTEQPKTQMTSVSAHSETQSSILQNVSATVYKDANCGCCKEWISHIEDNGLNATAHDVEEMSLFKDRYSVPQQMRSCHTAVTTDGYVFEGHVPAKYMAQFLAKPPSDAIGLAVPGMPVGSPGMEYQDKFTPYQVMQLNKDGTLEVYADIKSSHEQL